jgi:hypothetical protein
VLDPPESTATCAVGPPPSTGVSVPGAPEETTRREVVVADTEAEKTCETEAPAGPAADDPRPNAAAKRQKSPIAPLVRRTLRSPPRTATPPEGTRGFPIKVRNF